MATDTEFLAFVNRVMGETFQIAMLAKNGRAEEASSLAFTLLQDAGKKKRELLGLPEPDPDVDYDPDYHWDGTPRMDGEARREKDSPAPAGYDLSELRRLLDEGNPPE
jgi:hypothetical protein